MSQYTISSILEKLNNSNLFGELTSKSMFGGFGIFSDGNIFALISKGKVFLRIPETKVAETPIEQRFSYEKQGQIVTTRYQSFEPDSDERLVNDCRTALDQAMQEKEQQQNDDVVRIKDLPNMKYTTERMLAKAGIKTIGLLRVRGAVGAYRALAKCHKNVSEQLLWQIEGALTGMHWMVIPDKRKKELLAKVRR
ncbi:TfoX/Sxy family DNA transformation protein [Vibrio maritimus]|uniref:TfoX/Sxy family DNA transformation protein n=1 Tax=Vibrio maritimus TaxID=990268 RepID=UPI0040679B9C